MAERGLIVGSQTDCDVRVESPTVSGHHCRLTQRGASYLLEDLGSTNGTFVDGERIAGPRIVRREARVTLGQSTPLPWDEVPQYATIGRAPDNDVVIPLDMVSAQHARIERLGREVFVVDLGSTNGVAINDPANKVARAALRPHDAVFLGSHCVAAGELLSALSGLDSVVGTVLEPSRSDEPDEPVETSAAREGGWLDRAALRSARSWAVGAALSLVVVGVAIGGSRLLRRNVADGQPAGTVAAAAEDDGPKAPAGRDETSRPVAKSAGTQPRDAATTVAGAPAPGEPAPAQVEATAPAKTEAKPADPWDAVAAKLREAVYLLAVEDTESKRTWPAACACAFEGKKLLSTARMVTGLAQVKKQGWKLWAINGPLASKLEITTLRVHEGYIKSGANLEERIFFDLGLVEVAAELPAQVELVGSAEQGALEPGFPLGCVGVAFEEQPLYRFESNAAELTRGRVLEIAPLGPPPAPELLIFGAELPGRPYGAAVVTKAGKLCAVFAEFSDPEQSELKMNYAPLIDRDYYTQLVDGGLWVEPVVAEAAARPPASAPGGKPE